jgi:DNA recombination protein RmuC
VPALAPPFAFSATSPAGDAVTAELGFLVLAAVVGAAAGWTIAAARGRAAAQAGREPLQARVAGLETLGDELRKQLSARDLEVSELRSTVDAERAARAQAQARWDAARQAVEEQRRLLDDARERLTDTFKALSADALRESQAAFLDRAEAALGRRQEAMEASVRPLEEALRRYEEHARALEAARARAYGSLEEQLRSLASSSADLQREASNLAGALRAPNIRGRWGEITLHRVVELAGLAERCDYVEQATVEGASGRGRPDMIVHLPNGRRVVVDAKVPLAAYLEASSAVGVEERGTALGRHAQQFRQHMTLLASKAYWEQIDGTAELVVMFVPGEAFLAAALQADGTLLEDGIARRVLLATPTTLIGLLLAIAHGWREERSAANAQQISELGRQLYERLRTLGAHVEEVGSTLGRAVHAYNRAVGSLETRVLPSARRFRDLGAATGDDIVPLTALDQLPRPLTAPEYPQQLTTPDTLPGEPA